MQPATAGNVAARVSPGGKKKMSVSELTLFSLLIGTLVLIVIMFSDDNDGGHA